MMIYLQCIYKLQKSINNNFNIVGNIINSNITNEYTLYINKRETCIQ